MAKDPAFLFYHHDFLVGTAFMSMEEKGVYITLLCHLADKESLTPQEFTAICSAYAPTYALREKFKVDKNGNFFNERLREEVEKRKLYCESRRQSAKQRYAKDSAYAVRMGNTIHSSSKKSKVFKKPLKAGVVDTTDKYINVFKIPLIEDVNKYVHERGSLIDPQQWYDFYASKGWMVGRNKMKDWKAAVRTWEARDKKVPLYTDTQKSNALKLKAFHQLSEVNNGT